MDTANNQAQVAIITPPMLHREFCADFLDEKRCREWIITNLHPEAKACIACGYRIDERKEDQHCLERFFENKRVRCPKCGKFFTALSGTFLSGSHVEFRKLILLLLLLSIDVPARMIAPLIGQSHETVRIWRHKFRMLHLIGT